MDVSWRLSPCKIQEIGGHRKDGDFLHRKDGDFLLWESLAFCQCFWTAVQSMLTDTWTTVCHKSLRPGTCAARREIFMDTCYTTTMHVHTLLQQQQIPLPSLRCSRSRIHLNLLTSACVPIPTHQKAVARNQSKALKVKSKLFSWCFEPGQPLEIISGLQIFEGQQHHRKNNNTWLWYGTSSVSWWQNDIRHKKFIGLNQWYRFFCVFFWEHTTYPVHISKSNKRPHTSENWVTSTSNHTHKHTHTHTLNTQCSHTFSLPTFSLTHLHTQD